MPCGAIIFPIVAHGTSINQQDYARTVTLLWTMIITVPLPGQVMFGEVDNVAKKVFTHKKNSNFKSEWYRFKPESTTYYIFYVALHISSKLSIS